MDDGGVTTELINHESWQPNEKKEILRHWETIKLENERKAYDKKFKHYFN